MPSELQEMKDIVDKICLDFRTKIVPYMRAGSNPEAAKVCFNFEKFAESWEKYLYTRRNQ